MTAGASTSQLKAPGREVESSLAIIAEDPEKVVRSLSHLQEIGGYRLGRTDRLRIVDTYFDTPDRKLRRRGFALRIRVVKGSAWITLKGRRRRSTSENEERLEIEEPFSRAAIDEMRARAHLAAPPQARGRADRKRDPVAVLEAELGVEAIQRRETLRSARRLTRSAQTDGPVFAELALDRVRFDFDSTTVRHYEAELESKAPRSGPRAVRTVIEALTERYPTALHQWPYSKLATGRAIEELVAKGQFDHFVSPTGALTPEGYACIADYLERNLESVLS